MADYYAQTMSDGGKLKEGVTEDQVKEIVKKYELSDLEIEVEEVQGEGKFLRIYGYAPTEAHHVSTDGEPDYDEDCFDTFLEEFKDLIVEPLIVKEVGNEKLRYVCAYAWVLKPGEKVQSVSLEDAINNVLD